MNKLTKTLTNELLVKSIIAFGLLFSVVAIVFIINI